MRSFPLVFVVGPTGAGKSDWAVACAKQCKGSILNCDSVQSYQGLNIGAAKPSAEAMTEVKHFLFGIVEEGGTLTAGDYRRLAEDVLQKELAANPVFAVGGSGFYIQALEKGMFEIEKIEPARERRLRNRYANSSAEILFQDLRRLDPESAEELNPNDSYRIQRALLVAEGLGRKLSELKREFKPRRLPYSIVKLGFHMKREELQARLRQRTIRMLENGWIDEVRGLLDRGLGRWPVLQSVGYREVLQHLRGELKETNLVDQIVLRTFQLAKRQMTWFRRDQEIKWFDLTQSEDATRWVLHELDRILCGQE